MENLMKLDLADFGNIFRRTPADLDDQELLSLDFILHRAWLVKREGGLVNLGDKSFSFEALIERHASTKKEMSERAFRHPVSDELDQKTEPLLSRGEEETEKGVRQAFGSHAGKKGFRVSNLAGGILLWAHQVGTLAHEGEPTKRVHVYGKKWDLAPPEFEAVLK